VFTELTVDDQLSLSRSIAGRRRFSQERDRALMLFPNLSKHLARPVGLLSGGERQMVAIATALCAAPSLLLIDELSQGLAPAIISDLVGRIRQINRDGMTVLLVEQNPQIALALGQRVILLDAGRAVIDREAVDEGLLGEISRTYLGPGIANDPQSRAADG
jgi:branched-chain amino acid transport system ATP-binding protein